MRDVTVSVWNKFWSFQLIDGLVRGGFTVNALGSGRRGPAGVPYKTCWPSAISTQLGHQFPKLQERFFRYAISKYARFASQNTGGTRCFWGWNGHHLAAFKKAKAAGIPVILECGSTHPHWGQSVLAEEYKKRDLSLEQSLFNEIVPISIAEYAIADRICVPSRFVANTFIHHGIPAEKLTVNPYGADIAFWSQCKRAPHSNTDPFVVVYTAQIMLRKGIAYLLDAWRKLNPANAELWLIGGVSTDCEALVATLPSGVKLLGGKTHRELLEIYAQANAYVLPSLEEGLARSLLEAMAAGLPIIITEETGGSDVMIDGEDGWIVPSRDSNALATAFAEAIANPETTRKKGESARHRVAPYTWQAYGDRAASLLSNILK